MNVRLQECVMRSSLIILAALVTVVPEPVRAIIIDIPDDYPTIQQGIDAAFNGDTVLVDDGRYYERIDFVGKDIVVASEYIIDRDTLHIQNTVIDADTLVLGVADTGSVVRFVNGEYFDSVIEGFTIENGTGTINHLGLRCGGGILCYYSSPTIQNNIIVDNTGESGGGGIFCNYSNAVLRNNRIVSNSVYGLYAVGGGVACIEASILIENNIVSENECRGDVQQLGIGYGGGIYCDDSNPTVLNNVISENVCEGFLGYGGGLALNNCSSFIVGNVVVGNDVLSAENGEAAGGGISCDYASSPTLANNVFTANKAGRGGGISCAGNTLPRLVNCILWADTAAADDDEIYAGGSPSVTFCDVEDGWEGEGNIDLLPLFRDPVDGDFHLMSVACGDSSDSPCIDAGDPSMVDNLLNCEWGLGTVRSDMGSFGGEEIPTGVDDQRDTELPSAVSTLQNYPNPFNDATVIRYSLDRTGPIELRIYNILGQEIATAFEGIQNAGEHTVLWDAYDFPTGVYFARLEVAGHNMSIKLVLVK
jgi:hypothetical protein